MIDNPTAAILNSMSTDPQDWVSIATQPIELPDLT